jgi:hypothetical protein
MNAFATDLYGLRGNLSFEPIVGEIVFLGHFLLNDMKRVICKVGTNIPVPRFNVYNIAADIQFTGTTNCKHFEKDFL